MPNISSQYALQALQKKIQEARKPSPTQRAAATTPRVGTKWGPQGDRRQSGAGAGAAPQVNPNSVVGQIVRTWTGLVDKYAGGNQTLAATVVFVVVWWAGKTFLGRGCAL